MATTQFTTLIVCVFVSLALGGKLQHDSEHAPPIVTKFDVHENQLVLNFDHYKLAEGMDTKCHCKAVNKSFSATWYNPAGIPITQINDTRIRADQYGWLNMTDLRLNDTGPYMCLVLGTTHNATYPLTVYVMPTYFREGMIVLTGNLVLMLLLFSCICWRMIRDRNMRMNYIKYQNMSDSHLTKSVDPYHPNYDRDMEMT